MTFATRNHLTLQRRILVWLSLMGGALGVHAAQADTDESELRKLKADCHLEAESAELRGNALDAFVADCIRDLLSVEIKNLKAD